jgi:hypothetical protein
MMSNRTYTIAVATAITVRMIFAIDTVMKTTAAANRSRTHKLVRAKVLMYSRRHYTYPLYMQNYLNMKGPNNVIVDIAS